MSIDREHVDVYVISPALMDIGLYSDAANNLLLGTCAQETNMGTYLHQLDGPACGLLGMEPPTFDDIIGNYLAYRTSLKFKIENAIGCDDLNFLKATDMNWNLRLAAIMCRIHYLRVPEALPDADDVEGMAKYWKKYYNTELGKGTVKQFIDNYNRYCQ